MAPVGDRVSSATASRLAPPLAIGASLTAVTLSAADALARLKAVLPPPVAASAVRPTVPLVWSQAWNVMPAASVPFQLALGTKRTSVPASAASKRALPVAGVPKAAQVPPLLLLYCHAPLLLSTAVTAIPVSALGSASLTRPAINSDTSVPELLLSSSLMGDSALAPASTGALLRRVTRRLAPNSELLPATSVAVAVSVAPTLTPATVRLPLKLPLASVVRLPR